MKLSETQLFIPNFKAFKAHKNREEGDETIHFPYIHPVFSMNQSLRIHEKGDENVSGPLFPPFPPRRQGPGVAV